MSALLGAVSLDSADPAAPAAAGAGLDVASRDGRWRLGWSGRLDNRLEMLARWPAEGGLPDAALMAEAIAAGGVAAIGDAIGDFALAAWDSVDRCLWLARDAIGFRPLFYREESGPHGRHVRFSTDIRVLIDAGAAPEPNPGFVAEMLAGLVVSANETAFAGIYRVLPAQAMGFRAGERDPRRVTLWRPPSALPARRSDTDLIEECRERFFSAVAASLDGAGPMSAQLSGGLDSTGVLATAQAITGTPPDAYSIVFPSFPRDASGELVDETPFIDIAIAATGARSVRVDPLASNAFGANGLLRVMTRHGDLPHLPAVDALNYPLFARAAADGHTTMLTGLGGDFWLSGSLARLPWLLRRGRLAAAWRFFRAARRNDTLNATLAQLGAHLFTRLAPDWVRAARRRARPPRDWPRWMPDAFAERVHLAARLRRLSDRAPRVGDDVLQDSLLRLSLAEHLLTRESLYRAGADAGISVRHPMLDRRFVEFAIALPDDLRMRGAETRFVFRRALMGILPEPIRTRRSKGDGTALNGVAIARLLGGAPLAFDRAAARGWVTPSRLTPHLAPFLTGDPFARRPRANDDLVMNAITVELWLRNAGA